MTLELELKVVGSNPSNVDVVVVVVEDITLDDSTLDEVFDVDAEVISTMVWPSGFGRRDFMGPLGTCSSMRDLLWQLQICTRERFLQNIEIFTVYKKL